MTTSISDCGLADSTSRSQRTTAVWSCGSSVVRSNTTLYGFDCVDCAQAAAAPMITAATHANESKRFIASLLYLIRSRNAS